MNKNRKRPIIKPMLTFRGDFKTPESWNNDSEI